MHIQNRSARFHYTIEQEMVAGMVLLGKEVKSIRLGKVSFNDSHCVFIDNELWVQGLYIAPHGVNDNIRPTDPIRRRKLLLQKQELKKLHAKVKERGFTIVPLNLFFSKEQMVKITIALVRGKKLHDKRQSIKERDNKRYIQKLFKP